MVESSFLNPFSLAVCGEKNKDIKIDGLSATEEISDCTVVNGNIKIELRAGPSEFFDFPKKLYFLLFSYIFRAFTYLRWQVRPAKDEQIELTSLFSDPLSVTTFPSCYHRAVYLYFYE